MDSFIESLKKYLHSIPKRCRRVDYKKYNKRAAVLIPIVLFNGDLSILFTKRTAHLKNHSGEISFPGGRHDEIDENLRETVLREAEEELGLYRSDIDILGDMPQEFSVTYFRVHPFVGVIKNFSPYMLHVDKNEVEDLLLIPITFFLKKENRWSEIWLRNEEKHINYFYNYEGKIIWGLTGRITHTFLN
ncbi:MAG: CoA pyrophosphatase, partial [Calditerrivibrio sp.]|nr:CoA pyrophosphatase [Calditerrivibrio sp.]